MRWPKAGTPPSFELAFELFDVPEKKNAARSVTFAASVAHRLCRCSAPQSVKLDNVAQHVIDVVNQSDMLPDSYIPMMGRRRRKLTAKVRGDGVSLLAKVRRERFPRF